MAKHAFSKTTLGKKGSPYRRTVDNSTGNHGTASVMPVWIAGDYCNLSRKDASGDIPVNLGSGTPCRNDDTEAKQPSRNLARYDKHVGFSFRIALPMGYYSNKFNALKKFKAFNSLLTSPHIPATRLCRNCHFEPKARNLFLVCN